MTRTTDQERAEFEAQFKHLDLTQEPDAWGAPRYKHDAISLAWEAWQASRRAPAAQARKTLTDALAEYDKVRDHVAEQVGCFDGGCLVKRPKGMHTNGGCKCSKNSLAAQRMMYAGQRLSDAVRAITQEKQG